MNTLTIKGWQRNVNSVTASPIEEIHFRVSEQNHLKLEEVEEMLQRSGEKEYFIPVDQSGMELKTSGSCGALGNCRFRVYLNPETSRGQFHLVATGLKDNSFVYSNAVMIDQLG